MTISKTLATATKDDKEYIALESYEKFSSVPHYEIVIGRVGSPLAEEVIKVARTTWKRKFQEITK